MSAATQALAELPAAEASAIVKSERAARRDALKAVVDRNPNGKLAEKARLLISDVDQLDGWIAEAGGEEEFTTFICARVMAGETVEEFCKAYALDGGLVGAFLTENEERYERYKRAQAWRAEHFVAEAVPIGDGETPQVLRNAAGDVELDRDGKPIILMPDVARDKLRIDTRLKVAGMYNRQRFSDAKGAGVAVAANITIVHEGW